VVDLRIRPMVAGDVTEAERVTDAGFHGLDLRMRRVEEPVPQPRDEDQRHTWIRRTRHLLGTDPGGCWVAEDGEGLVGAVVSLRRETLWVLASYAVVPARQGQGIGRPLLAAALQHGAACTRSMLSSSADQGATRLYRQAGFDLHPQMHLSGRVDRTALPVVDKVREAATADVDLMDSLDRSARGAGHGPDHMLLLEQCRALVTDTTTGAGYAYVDRRGRLALLAASNRRTATRLLWAVLADTPADTPADGPADTSGEVRIGHVTAANQWVLDVAMAAGLRLGQDGYLGLRGMKPPSPYVHHGALL
jgi:GNAT superfamily N-acetyltransferase